MYINPNDTATIDALAAAACKFYGWRGSGSLDRNGQLFIGSNYAGRVREDGRLVLDNSMGNVHTIRISDAIEQFGTRDQRRGFAHDREAIADMVDEDGWAIP